MRRASIAAAIVIAAVSTAATVAGTVNEYQKLIAFDGSANDLFGASVAVDVESAVIGAPASASDEALGAAYTFTRNSNHTWTKEQKLIAADGTEGDEFGAAVAIDGDTLIVGSPRADDGSGAAYVFERRNHVWVERQRLAADAEDAAFGRSVALERDTALVGAPGEHGETGAVYVFKRGVNGTWEEVQKIAGPTPGDATHPAGRFGTSVALWRELALVGNPAEDGTGAAYLFEKRANGSWGELQRWTADDGEMDDGFGDAVSIHAYRAAVGADGAGGGTGSAYMFEVVVGGAWAMTQELAIANPAAVENFGRSVAVHSDTAVVGGSGSAHTFTRDPHTRMWMERDDLRASENGAELFGHSVGWDGGVAVIGASGDDQNGPGSGASFLFRISPVVSALFPQTIYARSRGVVQVAVLSGPQLDVSQIDPTTLRFGPARVEPVHDLSDSFTMNSHLRDVDLDGVADLVVHFRTRRSGIVCGEDAATLTAQTFDGRTIEVSGSVQAIGCQTSPSGRDRLSRPARR